MSIKKFSEFLNKSGTKYEKPALSESNIEQINEADSAKDAEEILAKLQAAMPELSKLIKKYTGATIMPTVELDTNRSGVHIFKIASADLIKEFGKLGPTMFSKINLYFWGGIITKDGKSVWFNPKVSYSHPNGGSNGTDFVWDSLWFNIEDSKWIEGRLLK